STESFYLLQSHINSHVFGSRFTEHALSRQALDDHSAYIPKGNWHNPFHYEHQKIINVRSRPICNHYPWWRIGDVANRQYDIVTSNANLNEFSREALFQYLSLIGEVLADDGALVAQCLGGGPVTYDTIFTNMKSAGFVPVALVQGDNVPSRTFVVSNGVFVGEKHPLYSKYASARPQFPLLDRNLDFVNSMFFINEDQLERKHVQSIPDILSEILDQIEAPQLHSGDAAPRRGLNVDAPNLKMELRDVNRLRRVAQLERIESGVAEAPKSFDRDKVDRSREALRTEAERIRISTEIVKLKEELEAMRSSRSWRITKPLRSVARLVRRRLPSVVRLAKWLRA
ncbi:MAG TPA: hypothetical protein VER98_07510, partial [Terriglobia bacterium]|nr:hypothetical protein [Terriglobia bacterium]